jgi:hypothetical protein
MLQRDGKLAPGECDVGESGETTLWREAGAQTRALQLRNMDRAFVFQSRSVLKRARLGNEQAG